MNALYSGYFATRIYLPLSLLSRRLRAFSREVRGKKNRFSQKTRLPVVSWKECTGQRSIKIWEIKKENGNVRISELGILTALAADCVDGTSLFEIGTFDGRTTLNLALNSPPQCAVYTLDLPPELATKYALAEGERHMVDKPEPGARYEQLRGSHPDAVAKIRQLVGDSATFDFSPYTDTCSLVFIDGSHNYHNVVSDSFAAMKMAKSGGVVIWHDYGIWEEVTSALEELGDAGHQVKNINGTSLGYWKKG